MAQNIEIEAINHCRKLGVIDEIAVRNLEIKNEFLWLKAKGLGSKAAIETLMKDNGLGWNSINEIVYGKYDEKKKKRDGRILK
jgi:hypothetical protein